jgi:predicted enzyme related to lactoylglutathione lyase
MSASDQVGQFVWRDLMSTDPEQAETFYRQLFGWSVDAVDMGGAGSYRMIRDGEQQLGGIVPLDPSRGIPSHWISYIAVNDVDATAAKAVDLGGTVLVPPFDIPGVGRTAVIGDPVGARFSPFAAVEGSRLPDVDAVSWNELATGDPAVAESFYGQLIGYTAEHRAASGSQPYTLLKRGGQQAGIFRKPAHVPQSLWVIYYHAADLDQSRAEVARLGGTPMGPVIDVPGVGRIAWATDPAGAVFALHEDPPM